MAVVNGERPLEELDQEAPASGRRRKAKPAASASADNAATAESDPEVGGIAADRLRSFIERIERLEEEKQAISSDIKDVFSESKSAGFDVSVIRVILAQRRKEPAEVEEQESLLDVYRRALGM